MSTCLRRQLLRLVNWLSCAGHARSVRIRPFGKFSGIIAAEIRQMDFEKRKIETAGPVSANGAATPASALFLQKQAKNQRLHHRRCVRRKAIARFPGHREKYRKAGLLAPRRRKRIRPTSLPLEAVPPSVVPLPAADSAARRKRMHVHRPALPDALARIRKSPPALPDLPSGPASSLPHSPPPRKNRSR